MIPWDSLLVSGVKFGSKRVAADVSLSLVAPHAEPSFSQRCPQEHTGDKRADITHPTGLRRSLVAHLDFG